MTTIAPFSTAAMKLSPLADGYQTHPPASLPPDVRSRQQLSPLTRSDPRVS